MLSKTFYAYMILFGLCYAGTIDPKTPDHKYVALAKEYKFVGKLCGLYRDGTRFCASAVAIDDHHILTAAHIVENSVSCVFDIDGKEFCITDVTINKDFNTKKFGVGDIAIGYSIKSFDLKQYPALYVTDDEVGKECVICGYGFTGNFNTGSTFHDNKKRAGSNIIDEIDSDMLICSPSPESDATKTSLEFFIASGDSGGGLFIDNKLAAINSCVMAVDRSPRSKYNEQSGHTRISIFLDWIERYKQKER